MNSLRFKLLVAFSLFWLIFSVALSVFFPTELPQSLSDYLFYQEDTEFGVFEWVIILLLVPSLISHVALLFLKNWARHIYSSTIIVFLFASVFGGPEVYTPFEVFAYELDTFLSGVIISLAYFSSISSEFN